MKFLRHTLKQWIGQIYFYIEYKVGNKTVGPRTLKKLILRTSVRNLLSMATGREC